MKKGRGSRHFSSLKIKNFLPHFPRSPSRRLRASPRLGPSRPVSGKSLWRLPGPFLPPPSHPGVVVLAAAEPQGPLPQEGWPLGVGGRRLLAPSPGAPQAATAPCWRAPVSLRRVRRPALRRPPARPRPPPFPGPSLRSVVSRRGSACTGGRRALRLQPTHPLAGALPAPSPLLKRATAGGRSCLARGRSRGLGAVACAPGRARVRPAAAGLTPRVRGPGL